MQQTLSADFKNELSGFSDAESALRVTIKTGFHTKNLFNLIPKSVDSVYNFALRNMIYLPVERISI